MKSLAVSGIALLLALSPCTTLAADKVEAPGIVADQYRVVADGRPVQVIVPQRQIASSFDLGRIADAANGGGLLGMMVIHSMDDRRETMGGNAHAKAEAAIEPLRVALRGFDVDGLAMATTRRALARPDWLRPRDFAFSKDRDFAHTAFIASNTASQYAFVTYRYELSPDASQLRVFATLALVGNPTPASKKPAPPQTLYQQNVLSVVQLRTRSYEPRENVARWTADGGRLAKAAFDAAFARMDVLLPLALGYRQSDITALTSNKREKAFAAGFYGPLIQRNAQDPDDVLIWTKTGLIQVQAVS